MFPPPTQYPGKITLLKVSKTKNFIVIRDKVIKDKGENATIRHIKKGCTNRQALEAFINSFIQARFISCLEFSWGAGRKGGRDSKGHGF